MGLDGGRHCRTGHYWGGARGQVDVRRCVLAVATRSDLVQADTGVRHGEIQQLPRPLSSRWRLVSGKKRSAVFATKICHTKCLIN